MVRKFNPDGMMVSPAYSHGVEIATPARMLYISGQVGALPDGSIAKGIEAQVQAVIANIDRVLAGADMTRADVVKYTIFLVAGIDINAYRAAAGPLLPVPPPASSLVFVQALASPDFLVEIEAVAMRQA
ncbi:hypothetical protein GCM10007913_43640 [Devosia yakushimensis]|uniref:RidA family protein n=1 Tax=Devosia yakushimensis TaxID=470028 RepID=A0ABQ5UNW4_9HYPH|nr:RidA family protein [Devosia yakushimensis]GLQ12431.1 hypothetical protein GCM10007913_43640 [Devosia yakushimensis]